MLAPRLLNRSAVGGIVGKLSFDREEILSRTVIEQMLDDVATRTDHADGSNGRPARAIYSAPGVAVASTGGLSDGFGPSHLRTLAPSHLHVAVDADLTNAEELRGELGRACYVEPGNDAALVALAFMEWGLDCFSRFEGGFACAIWNSRTRRLLLARDHLGLKPLVFALLHGRGIVFASEIRALFHDPGVERRYNPAAIDAYLALGYVPAPLTAFERISKVEPAQIVIADGRRLHTKTYWDVPHASAHDTFPDAVEEIDSRLRMAVRRIPLPDGAGILYSGGIASTALLGALPPGSEPVVTVALEQDVPELARSHAAAQHLGRAPELDEISIETPELAAEVAARFDEPNADPAAILQHAVCRSAQPHMRVALTGHGAAALFGAGSRLTVWDERGRRAIYTRTFAWQLRETDPRSRYRELPAAWQDADPGARAWYVQLRSVLPDSTLAIADHASVAAGLPLRYPWLDRRVVERVAMLRRFPAGHGLGATPLLRRLLARRLPHALTPPRAEAAAPPWLNASLPVMVPKLLLSPRFDGRGIVSRPALRQLWDEHCSGTYEHSRRFWSLLMLELWFREYIDGDAMDAPLEYAVLKAA